MIRHIVLIKLADNTPEGHIEMFRDKMNALLAVITEIKSLEFGVDVLQDNRSWHVAMTMVFATVEDLRSYQTHPAHMEIVDFNKDFLTDLASVDYHFLPETPE